MPSGQRISATPGLHWTAKPPGRVADREARARTKKLRRSEPLPVAASLPRGSVRCSVDGRTRLREGSRHAPSFPRPVRGACRSTRSGHSIADGLGRRRQVVRLRAASAIVARSPRRTSGPAFATSPHKTCPTSVPSLRRPTMLPGMTSRPERPGATKALPDYVPV